MKTSCQIAIIGAGIAGLGAAQAFLASGVKDILILEAQNYIGGRINTKQICEGTIDLGAQWLHSTDTLLYDIAKKHNIIDEETIDEAQGIFVRDDGYVFDDWIIKKVDFEVGKIFEELKTFVDSKEYPKSVGVYLKERFNDFLNVPDMSLEQKELYLQVFDWHLKFQQIDNSCSDLEYLSAKDWGNYSCTADGQTHMSMKGGYSALINILIKQMPSDIFVLNCGVNRICFCDGIFKIYVGSSNKIIETQHVIVTCSIGTLKSVNLFDFNLPRDISNSLAVMGFESIGKIFLLFENSWWQDKKGFQLIWRRCKVKENDHWTKHISGFDKVIGQSKMLMGWVSAEGIMEMEKRSEKQVGEDCIVLLRKFLKDDNIPIPQEVYKTNWMSSPWIRGSYSYASTRCDDSNMLWRRDFLAEPIYFDEDVFKNDFRQNMNTIPRILFAGEAVHPNHFSTTHGAFESGRSQAQKIINFINKNSNILEKLEYDKC